MSETSAGKITLDLEVGKDTLKKQLNTMTPQSIGMGSFKKLGLAMAGAFSLAVAGAFAKASMGLASDLQEVQNVVDTVFGESAGEIDSFAKSALKSFGLSELSAKRFTSTMGAMLKSSGLTAEQTKLMSTNLTALSGDMASFYNLSGDEAFQKIRAGISGETEPLKQLGINLSVANMEAYAFSKGISKSYQSMSQAEQSILRYNYLLSVTTDAQGDFARTSGGWANQTKLMSEQFKEAMVNIGSGLIQIFGPALKFLNAVLAKLIVATQYFKAFAEAIMGVKSKASSASSSVASVGESSTDMGKAVGKAGKALSGSLMGFDELNVLAESTAGSLEDAASAGGSIGAGIEPIDMGMDFTQNKPLIPEESIALFKTQVDGMKTTMEGLKESILQAFAPLTALGNLILPQLGTMFTSLWEGVKTVFAGILEAAKPVFDWFVVSGIPLLASFGLGAFAVFKSIFETVKSIFGTLWSGAVQPALMLLSTMMVDALNILAGFWQTWGTKIVGGIVTAFNNIKMLFQTLWTNFLGPIVSNMLNQLKQFWDNHLKGLVAEILTFVGATVKAFLDIYNQFIVPLIKAFVEQFGPGISNVIQFVTDTFFTVVGVVADVAKGVLKSLRGIIEFITGIFTGDWKRAWNGVKLVFEGIFDGIKGIFKGVINSIIDGMNFLIRKLNSFKIDVPDWVPVVGGKKYGFNLSTIPKLADGGIVSSPTLAMIGERGKEAVVPLENTDFAQSIGAAVGSAVIAAMQFANSNSGTSAAQNQEIVLKLDSSTFARVMVPAMRKEAARTGVTVLEGV